MSQSNIIPHVYLCVCPESVAQVPEYSLPLQEVGHEGHVVLAVPLSALGQFAHHGGVPGGRGQQEKAAVVLSVMQALLGQAELALADGQLRQLLPLLLRLQEGKATRITNVQ